MMRTRPMKKSVLKDSFKAGEVLIGTWCMLPSAASVNAVAASGVDFVIVDVEHGSMDFSLAEDMVRAAESEGCSPMLRIGSVDEGQILKALDIGAHGILVAHVSSPDDVRNVVSYAKYHPQGSRGYSPYTRAGGYGSFGIEGHAARQNDEVLIGVLIEGQEGIERLDEIAACDGIDLIYVGAYDLSQALGIPGRVHDPRVRSAVETAMLKIRRGGKVAGGHVARTADDMAWMVEQGMQFITTLPDATVMCDAFRTYVEDLRNCTRARGGQR